MDARIGTAVRLSDRDGIHVRDLRLYVLPLQARRLALERVSREGVRLAEAMAARLANPMIMHDAALGMLRQQRSEQRIATLRTRRQTHRAGLGRRCTQMLECHGESSRTECGSSPPVRHLIKSMRRHSGRRMNVS